MKNFFREPEGKSALEDLGVDGRTILKWALRNWIERVFTEFI
jgi:hypothetical protein